MERNLLWICLFMLFLGESTVFPSMLPTFGTAGINVQFVLVAVLMIGLHYHRYSALLYGMCFGFMHDLLFGQLLGVTAFTMGLVGYLIGLWFANKYEVMFRDLLVIAFGNLLFFGLLMLFYFLFGLHNVTLNWSFISSTVLPSIVVNLLFAAAIYVPAKAYLHKMTVRYGSFYGNS